MEHRDVSRRTLLKGGSAALAGLSLQVAGPARGFQRDDDREQHACLSPDNFDFVPSDQRSKLPLTH